ncbi:MAG: type II toxin-antitoxin system VapC family toxin [Acidimicrobiales bacterium]|nr:type II toxin-antitoxin system VapC family toxin [Acidimicrobiales bacterium]
MPLHLLADTQVLIWYVTGPERLTTRALEVLHAETDAGVKVGVSSFAMVEVTYAVEKSRNPLTVEDAQAILAVLHDEASPFEVLPVDLAVSERVRSVPRDENADPGDRILVATAEVHDLRIVSSDGKVPSMTKNSVIW